MKALSKHLAYVPLMFLLVPFSLYAQNFWQQTNGPFGGTVAALAINSRGDIFAGIQYGGVYRSTDNGNNWTQINRGLPADIWVTSFAINNSSGDIFTGTRGSGVFRSTNNGNNWTQINNGLRNLDVYSLAINGDGNIFAGTIGSGVFRSTDNGNTWTQTGLTNVSVYSLAINGSGDIFAGTATSNFRNLFRSTDNGNNWTQTSLGITVLSLAINSSGYIFVGIETSNFGGGVFRSTNNGANYTQISSGLPTTKYYVLSLAINRNGDIFAGIYPGGVFRLTNNGNSWTQTGLTNSSASSLAINSSGDIFAGTSDEGVFRSTNNGTNWAQINNGLTANDITSLAINSSGDVFASVYHGGVFRLMDNGDNWTQINNGLTFPYVSALAINNSDQIFAGTRGSGVFRSTDKGDNWTQTGLTNGDLSCLAINSSGNIFAGTQGSGVLRSINNGTNWDQTGLINRSVYSLAINNSSGYIFAGTDNEGVFRSTDNGNNWTKKISGLPNTWIHSLAINSSGDIFAGTRDGGVFRSGNNGDNWTPTGLTNIWVHSLAINSSGDIFAGTRYDGVFRSRDNGNTWAQINSGLTANFAQALAINRSGYIFAGTLGSSVFRSVGTTTVGVAPSVTTNTATNVSLTSATLNGTVNPNDLSTAVKFEYGTTTGYGSEITATPSPVNGASAVSVSAALTGLSSNTLYHYRVVGTNSAGTNTGADQTFTTTSSGSAPTVTTNVATNVSSTSATLTGTVNPNSLSTIVIFQYGTTTNYSTEATATPNPVTGPSAVAINAMITGLTPNMTYHYRAVGTNSAGTTNGADQTFITSIDQTAPNISHTAITSAPSGQSQTIAAILIDNIGIQSAVLNYRVGGASAYTAVAMSKTSGDNYQGTIPVGWITERGVEYNISAQDAAGNKATFPTTNAETKPQVIQVTNSNLQFLVSTPVKAYRMISIPFDLNDRSAASVLQDDFTGAYDQTLWRLLRYVNPTTNIEFGASGFPDFAPGAGFWLITKEAKRLDAGAGKSVTTAQNFVITLPAGWSQIGNPFAFTVNWSDVIKGANVGDKLVGYQGSLNEATGYDYTRTQLVPFEGYFVNNRGSTPTTIEIPPKAASNAAPRLAADWKSALQGNEWALQITAACDRYLDKDNYLGALNDASDEWDANDFSEAPFFDQHVALYFPHPEWKKYPDLYTGDFRETKAEGDYWDFVVRSEVAKSEVVRSEVVLRLAEVQNLPAEWEVVLLDKASHVAIDFGEKKQYSFPSGNGKTVREFRIVVGKKDFVETNDLNLSGVPQSFALGQNYPNPFSASGATVISFQLPVISNVKLSIYNLNGQLVHTLFDGEQSAGRYTVAWDGTNASGDRVVSGLYLVRMEAGNFVAVRKMIMTK